MMSRSVRAALVLVIFLAIGEVIARYALGLGTPPLVIEHPAIEYMMRPGQEVRRFGNRYAVNEYGMRSDPFESEKKGPRIMVFGDSVVNGGTLTDQGELATHLLQSMLTDVGLKYVVVGNVSAGSWGPGNWLAYAKEYGFF